MSKYLVNARGEEIEITPQNKSALVAAYKANPDKFHFEEDESAQSSSSSAPIAAPQSSSSAANTSSASASVSQPKQPNESAAQSDNTSASAYPFSASQEKDMADIAAAKDITPIPMGVYRYLFTDKAGRKVDVSFGEKPTWAELAKLSQRAGMVGMPEEAQPNFQAVRSNLGAQPQNTFAGGAQDQLISMFPRVTADAAKGEGLSQTIPAGILDAASAPFRVGAGAIDLLAGSVQGLKGNRTPSSYYTGGTTEDTQADSTGMPINVPRMGPSSFLQNVVRAPENALGLGAPEASLFGVGASKAEPTFMPIAKIAEGQNVRANTNAAAQGGGNLGFMGAESQESGNEPTIGQAAIGALAPGAVIKGLGQGALTDRAVHALQERIKIRPSDQLLNFPPDERVLFERGLIPVSGSDRGIYDELSNQFSNVSNQRANVANEVGNQARVAADMPAIDVKGDIQEPMFGPARINAPMESAVTPVNDIYTKIENELTAKVNRGTMTKDEQDAIMQEAGNELRNIPKIVNPETNAVSIPIDALLNRRTTWFDNGNVNKPSNLTDFSKAQREAYNMLWESTNEAAHAVPEIADKSAQLQELIPLWKGVEHRLPALGNNHFVSGVGGLGGAAIQLARRTTASNPGLLARYNMGKMISQGPQDATQAAVFPATGVGFSPYYGQALRDEADQRLFAPDTTTKGNP